MSGNKSMVLAYKALYEISRVFPLIKSDIKDLATFCFPLPPLPCGGWIAWERWRWCREFTHIQSQGSSCDPPWHRFQRTGFLLFKQIYGEAFPGSSPEYKQMALEMFCEVSVGFLRHFYIFGDRTMKEFRYRLVVAVTCVKVGFSWSRRRRDMATEDIPSGSRPTHCSILCPSWANKTFFLR